MGEDRWPPLEVPWIRRHRHPGVLLQEAASPVMDFTDRPMRGMVYVGPAGVASDAAPARWVERAVNVASLEPAAAKR